MSESTRVADALARGEIPWRLPAYPRNILSGRPYGGVTPILLQIASTDALGCTSPWWGTIADWALMGCKVPFGIGVRVPTSASPLHNWEFTDKALAPPVLPEVDPTQLFESIVKNAGIRIEHVFDCNCKYVGTGDYIVMPHRWMFEIGSGGLSGWHDALGHEIFHWTEREQRTGWDSNDDVAELRARSAPATSGRWLGPGRSP